MAGLALAVCAVAGTAAWMATSGRGPGLGEDGGASEGLLGMVAASPRGETGEGSGSGAGSTTGAGSSAGAGTGTGSGSGTGSGAGTGSGSSTETGSGSSAETGSGSGSGSGTGSGSSSGGAPTPLAQQVREGVRGALPAIRTCYETALRDDDGLAGRVVLELEIQPDGHVALGQVAEDELIGRAGTVEQITRDQIVGCLEATIGELEFDLPEGTTGVTMVRYPIVMSADAEGI